VPAGDAAFVGFAALVAFATPAALAALAGDAPWRADVFAAGLAVVFEVAGAGFFATVFLAAADLGEVDFFDEVTGSFPAGEAEEGAGL
jgi:hypothetical protein